MKLKVRLNVNKQNVQAFIITALANMFHYLRIDRWKLAFQVLSIEYFGSADYYSEVREILLDYILKNNRFRDNFFVKLNEYKYPKMMEEGE